MSKRQEGVDQYTTVLDAISNKAIIELDRSLRRFRSSQNEKVLALDLFNIVRDINLDHRHALAKMMEVMEVANDG